MICRYILDTSVMYVHIIYFKYIFLHMAHILFLLVGTLLESSLANQGWLSGIKGSLSPGVFPVCPSKALTESGS